MTPEKQARVLIDQHLHAAGWMVQDASAINLSAGTGVAVREFPLTTGYADYLLYANGKAIGVVEAKPEGYPLKGVETQSSKYTFGLPAGLPHYRLPLPFAYETTGTAITKEPMPVIYNPAITIETFDFIVIDECHRSIYNLWRQVLDGRTGWGLIRTRSFQDSPGSLGGGRLGKPAPA